jgi:hypothetical protein
MAGMSGDRIPCVNPRCGRTAARKYSGDYEICCHKCWRTLPRDLVARYRQLRARYKKIGRLFARERRSNPAAAEAGLQSQRMNTVDDQINRLIDENWRTIRDYFRPALDARPQELDRFLKEIFG